MNEQKYNVIMCYGTFDILHPGHEKILSHCIELGHHVIAALSDDKISKFPYEIRERNLQDQNLCHEISNLDGITLVEFILEKRPNFLVVGEKPTHKKVQKAKELKIKILTQDEWIKMLNKTS